MGRVISDPRFTHRDIIQKVRGMVHRTNTAELFVRSEQYEEWYRNFRNNQGGDLELSMPDKNQRLD